MMNHPLQGLLPEEQRLHPVVNDFRLKSTNSLELLRGHNSSPLYNSANQFLNKIHPGLINLQMSNMPSMVPDPVTLNRVLNITTDELLYPVHTGNPCPVLHNPQVINEDNSKYSQQVIDSRRKAVASTNALKSWLFEHRKNPYPTKAEKIMLAILTKMSLTQVSTWFANARRRLKKECITSSGDCDILLEESDVEIDVGTEVNNHDACAPYTCSTMSPDARDTSRNVDDSCPYPQGIASGVPGSANTDVANRKTPSPTHATPTHATSANSPVSTHVIHDTSSTRNSGTPMKRPRIWSVEDMINGPDSKKTKEQL